MAEDPETGKQEYKPVVQTFIREKAVLVHIFIDDEEIITTPEHPFYVEGKGFVSAGELNKEDFLRTSEHKKLFIKDIQKEYLEKPVKVYNFEVEGFHTYYVSEKSILVHNACTVPGVTFEGTIYRNIDERYDPLDIDYTVKNNHRYTGVGEKGLYFGSSERIVKAEVGNYISDFSGRKTYSYDVKLDNMLNLTDPKVRDYFGVTLDQLTIPNGPTKYIETQRIGKIAIDNGYNGILAPSASADGGINIILFNLKGVK